MRRGGGGGGDAISSVLHTQANTGAHRHAHTQTMGISTRMDEIRSATHTDILEMSDSCAEWPKRSNRKMVGENIGFEAVKNTFLQSLCPSLEHTQINKAKTTFTETQTPTSMQRKHQLPPVLSADKHTGFLIHFNKTQGSGKYMLYMQVCKPYRISHNMLICCLFCLSRCSRGPPSCC